MNVRLPLLLCLFAIPVLSQENKGSKVDFQKDIWPILEKRCIECHSAPHTTPDGKQKKPKGGIVLDSKDGITTSQNKTGKAVVAGKPDESLMYEAISLPADDEDRMPPAKKGDPLAQDQIDLIKQWIEGGAAFGTWTGKKKAADKDKPAGKEAEKPEEKANDKEADQPGKHPSGQPPKKTASVDPLPRLQAGLRPLPTGTLEAFADGPFRVANIGEDSPLLRVTCAGFTDEVDDRALSALTPLAEHVTELDLGRSKVGDEGLAIVAKMPRLTSLDLRQTQVSNQGVASLAACKELRSLNLFGTKTGDYAMSALAALKHLEHLYLWQTEVSAAAVVRLRESVPGVRVVIAADLPEAMATPAGGGRRRGGK